MDENTAMMNYKGQKPESQNPAKGTAPGFRPCRMAAKGCKERHQLDRCGLFGRMSSEQKLAALQERQLCVFCYKHQSSQVCYAKSDAGYRGCTVSGCGAHHADELHWVTQMARLFSVHAQPAGADPGAQIFSLRQNLKQDLNVAYDNGADEPSSPRSMPRGRV